MKHYHLKHTLVFSSKEKLDELKLEAFPSVSESTILRYQYRQWLQGKQKDELHETPGDSLNVWM